ncbi:hypothetical protein [Paracoccus benzoatiresistens]|uniref:Transporter n=1 Tax=Paracoccus benzoatiresistens TaxID=2997341 RepID=A0ABT4J9L1_9RHOB|nr:hypothetical protein [Paracoccus sp. EF6]MCZ0963767.1 hypothetical protein [Paracoccus sp. EF6]
MPTSRQPLRVAALGTALALAAAPALAVEGGIGAYLMGTRDIFAGIVLPPGTYLSFTYDYLEGSADGLSVGGLPIRADTDLKPNLLRVGITQSFATELWGGTPAVNLTIPIVSHDLTWTAVATPSTERQSTTVRPVWAT